ncbi:MAG: hypothetical protein ACLFQK_10475, partial [Fibrobacterota bacterium]
MPASVLRNAAQDGTKGIIATSRLHRIIEKKYLDKKNLFTMIDSLPPSAREVFLSVAHRGSAGLFLDEIDKIVFPEGEADLPSIIDSLLSRLLIIGTKEGSGKFYTPPEIKETAKENLDEDLFSRIKAGEQKGARLRESFSLITDISVILVNCLKSNIKITKNGLISKKSFELLSFGTVTAPAAAFSADESPNPWGVSEWLAVILDFCRDHEMISVSEGEIVLLKGAHAWFETGPKTQTEKFMRYLREFWKDGFLFKTGAVGFLVRAKGPCFYEAFSSVLALGGRDRPEKPSSEALKQVLLNTGLADRIVTDAGAELFAAGKAAEDFESGIYKLPSEAFAAGFTVTPDMEIFAPLNIAPRQRYLLDMTCSLLATDTMLRYKIERETLLEGLEKLEEIDLDIAAFFMENSS